MHLLGEPVRIKASMYLQQLELIVAGPLCSSMHMIISCYSILHRYCSTMSYNTLTLPSLLLF